MLQSGRTSEGLKNSQHSKKIPARQRWAVWWISCEDTHTHLFRWCCFSPPWRQPKALISDKNKGITDQRSGSSVESTLIFMCFHFLCTMNIHIRCWLICDYKFLFKRKHKVLKIWLCSAPPATVSGFLHCFPSSWMFFWHVIYTTNRREQPQKILKLLTQL